MKKLLALFCLTLSIGSLDLLLAGKKHKKASSGSPSSLASKSSGASNSAVAPAQPQVNPVVPAQGAQAAAVQQAGVQANTNSILIWTLSCAAIATMAYSAICVLDDDHLARMHGSHPDRVRIFRYGAFASFAGATGGAVSGAVSYIKKLLPSSQNEVVRSLFLTLMLASATLCGVMGIEDFRSPGGITNARSYIWSAAAYGLFKECINNILDKKK